MAKEIQRINPAGLHNPSPNGYSHVAMVAKRLRSMVEEHTAFGIAPPGATIIYIADQGGEDENGNLVDNFAAQLKQAFANLRML
ncbi:MAG TPA: hypothetical protein V6C91_01435 [Coleofasciculaceae cyanobacterium]